MNSEVYFYLILEHLAVGRMWLALEPGGHMLLFGTPFGISRRLRREYNNARNPISPYLRKCSEHTVC